MPCPAAKSRRQMPVTAAAAKRKLTARVTLLLREREVVFLKIDLYHAQ